MDKLESLKPQTLHSKDAKIVFSKSAQQLFLSYALYDSILDEDMSNVHYLLLSKKADPNRVLDEYGLAPIHCATGIGSEEFGMSVVGLCLDCGGDPNLRTLDGMTPVLIASLWGRNNVLKLLLSRGGDPLLFDDEGCSGFDYASQNGNVSTYNILTSFIIKNNQISSIFEKKLQISENDTSRRKKRSDTQSKEKNVLVPLHKSESDCSYYTDVSDESSPSYHSASCCLDQAEPKKASVEFSEIENQTNTVEIFMPSMSEDGSIFTDVGAEESTLNTAFWRDSFSDKLNATTISPGGTHNSLDSKQHNSSDESVASSLSSCPTDVLKQNLKKHNIFHGPVQPSTKRVYLRQLKKLNRGEYKEKSHSELRKFNDILTSTLSGKLGHWVDQWISLERSMTQDFQQLKSPPGRGLGKIFFTYILLDPFMTKDLAYRQRSESLESLWATFLPAIFYIGKGKNNRPLDHFTEASKFLPYGHHSLKIKKIHEIWRKGAGVVCLNIFHNVSSDEAHTREAAMIDALEGGNLTNLQRGEYYGSVKSWSNKKKCQLGVVLLYKALQILLAEGERQIFPRN